MVPIEIGPYLTQNTKVRHSSIVISVPAPSAQPVDGQKFSQFYPIAGFWSGSNTQVNHNLLESQRDLSKWTGIAVARLGVGMGGVFLNSMCLGDSNSVKGLDFGHVRGADRRRDDPLGRAGARQPTRRPWVVGSLRDRLRNAANWSSIDPQVL